MFFKAAAGACQRSRGAQFVCFERQDQISIDNITVVVLLPMLPLPRLLLSLISSQTFGVENYAETFQKKDLYRF